MNTDNQKKPSHQYLDKRWIGRYHQLISYDAHWWWSQSGPFEENEQLLWRQLLSQKLDAITKKQLNELIVLSRDRELFAAQQEQRQPRLRYPVLQNAIEEIHTRLAALQSLNEEILRYEGQKVVRDLYHDTITEEIHFLRLIEATYREDNERYWELTQVLYPKPSASEMEYPLLAMKKAILEGLRYSETVNIAHSLIDIVNTQFHLREFIPNEEIISELQQPPTSVQSNIEKEISAQAAQRFFEQILHESGYQGWHIEIDPKAGGASVASALHKLTLPDKPMALTRIRHLLSHELAGHIARSTAGEQSPLGLLAFGTAGYMATEEGLALFNERHVASLHGEEFSDFGTWAGMLAVGLATGIVTPPQSFMTLLTFFEQLRLQQRLIKGLDANRATAQKQAQKWAISRCLRTFRGAPNLDYAGIAYTKDVVYWRGLRLIEQAVSEDADVLNRLAIGKVALNQLDALQELNMPIPSQPLREKAFNPGMNTYILSFENENRSQ